MLDAPPELGPIGVVAYGLPAVASTAFEGWLEQLKQRKAVIDGHGGLRKRELLEMDRLVYSIAEAFRAFRPGPAAGAAAAASRPISGV